MESGERPIRVLHVDDEPDFLDLAATFLERIGARITVESATDASAGLDRLQDGGVDCIVSDFDMPEQTGIEFLETVREDHPALPFILFTGKGSEEVASDAISAGVTDYLQKGTDTSQFTVLANRVENAVGQYRAEQAIEETEHRYRRLIEESSDIITIVDPNGTFTYVSPAAERLLGYSSDDLLGENGFSYIHPEDQPETMQRLAELVEDPSTRITAEFRFELPDGDWIWLEAKGRNLLDDPIIEGIVVSVRDLTERREHETALQREHARFAALFEELGDPVVEVGFEDDEATIRAINRAFETVFGVAEADVLGESLDDYIIPAMDREDAQELNGRLKAGEHVERELERLTADGPRTFLLRAVPFTVDGEPRAHGIYLDITDRTQYEKRLHTLHDAARDLLAAESRDAIAEIATRTATSVLGLPVNGVHLYDPETDTLVPVASSDASHDVVGDPPSIRPGEGLVGRAYESGEPQFHDDIRESDAVYNPETPIRSELVLPFGHHGVFIVSSTAVGDFDDFDTALAQVLAATVETALDRAERQAELEDRTRELQQQNERLDQFASVVSHDLRNPLNVAAGRLELARADVDSPHLEQIEAAHERMLRLIDSVLSLARQGDETYDTEPVDLRDVAERSWSHVDTGTATLVFDSPDTIIADSHRLQQLLENLFRNSIEHGSTSPRSRAHEDRVEHGDIDVTITVGAIDGEDGFYVADDGPGIPPDAREAVFDSGHSSTTDGTGLGLAIVLDIATAHGWTIDVTESEAGGARFDVTNVEIPPPTDEPSSRT